MKEPRIAGYARCWKCWIALPLLEYVDSKKDDDPDEVIAQHIRKQH